MNNKENIGKYYKLTTTQNGHPKIKFEKHLPIAKVYDCVLVGKLKNIITWRYEVWMDMEEIKFPLQKLRSKEQNYTWRINELDIVSFEELTEENYKIYVDKIKDIKNVYEDL